MSYLTTATKLDPHSVQAQSLLGQLYYQRGDYAHAAEAEEVVVASNTESALAHRVLANSCLKLKQFEKARAASQWMVDQGGSEGAAAKLILGQALAGLRKNTEAIQVLKSYLDGEPASDVVPKVQELITQLERRASPGGDDASDDAAISDPAYGAEDASLTSSVGMPPDVDQRQPPVVPSVQCPANLLDMAATRSKELVDDVAQFSAIEEMTHESLSVQGIARNRETRKFNYLVSITEPPQGALIVQEYRNAGILDMPEKISTTGLAVLAIAFHPLFRDDFEMTCEGLGDFNGQAAWLVHFRQRAEKPAHLRTYVVNGNNYPIRLKGRAWIAADTLQIIHLETDLVSAVPAIRLMSEHTSVSYGPVQFKKANVDLWLPKSADLYVQFAKHRFHRCESFDHFMLFATDAVDKPKVPTSGASQIPAPDHGAGSRRLLAREILLQLDMNLRVLVQGEHRLLDGRRLDSGVRVVGHSPLLFRHADEIPI